MMVTFTHQNGTQVAVNSEAVTAVFPSQQHPGYIVVRTNHGHGFIVAGDFNSVMTALGFVVTPPPAAAPADEAPSANELN